MHGYTLAHLSDAALLRDLAALVAQDRMTTAILLAHIAEVDARRLYAPAGYPSMFAYCVEELRLSEDAAAKRIQAARAARRFPFLFAALAEGRLHLGAVCLLAPHLTPENAGELVEAATHRRKVEIETWLARRFGAPEPRAMVRVVRPAASSIAQHAPGHAGVEAAAPAIDTLLQHAPGHLGRPKPEPPPERYLVQVTIDKSTHDKLRHAQTLLSHAVPGGNVAKVLDRALDALIAQLEKRKFAATSHPREPRHSRRPSRPRSTRRERYIPAPVRRAVWERDQGRCTFVSANGRRCSARCYLEFDHVEAVARGGRATVDGMRLRCRAHNQFEAERVFGAGFMSQKREEARIASAKRRGARLADATARESAKARADAEARARHATQEVSGRT
jgi:5-methylcytosine-specific restriction endonuclease McrA